MEHLSPQYLSKEILFLKKISYQLDVINLGHVKFLHQRIEILEHALSTLIPEFATGAGNLSRQAKDVIAKIETQHETYGAELAKIEKLLSDLDHPPGEIPEG